MGAIAQRAKDWWANADRTQRLVTVFGSVFLVALLAFTFYFATRPKMQVLFPGLPPQEQGIVVEELRARGIPVELDTRGNVMVPEERLAEARMNLATANKLPSGGPQGIELLDGINSFTTPGQEREKIKAMKEGELAQSIQTMAGVASAIVHINFGKDSPFSDQTVPPTAVVNIVEQSGTDLGPTEGKAIARLVQNAVTGLTPENVTVLTSDGRIVYDGAEVNSADGTASRKLEAEIAESKRREIDLQRRLDRAFGPGNTIAMVQVTLDMDAVERQERRFEPAEAAAVVESATETLEGGVSAGAAGGPAGLASNFPGAPATAAPEENGDRYSSTVSNKQFPTNETLTTTKRAAGALVGMNVSVVANQTVISDVAPVDEIVRNYLGPWQGNDAFSASVTAVEFDKTAATADQKAAAAAASANRIQQALSLLPIAALLVVGFMVVKALGKGPRLVGVAALPTGGTMQVGYARAGDTVAPSALPVSTDPAVNQQVQEALAQLRADEPFELAPNIESIRAKVDVPLEQIRKLAKQKPDIVAMLLKTWIMEERR